MKTIYLILIIIAIISSIYGIIYLSTKYAASVEIKRLNRIRKIDEKIRYPILEDLIKFASEKAKENDIKLIPSFGTLLGLVREKEIIRHDYDIDLFLYEEDWFKFKKIMKENSRYKYKELNHLWHHKFQIYDEETELGIDFERIYNSNNEIKLDVFLSFTGNGVREGNILWKEALRKKFKKDIFEPLEKRDTKYGALHFPNKSKELLEIWYGKDWETPR